MTDIDKRLAEIFSERLPKNKTYPEGVTRKELYFRGLNAKALSHMGVCFRLREAREQLLYLQENPDCPEAASFDEAELRAEVDELAAMERALPPLSNDIPGVNNNYWSLAAKILAGFAYGRHAQLVGRPGVAKTATVREIANALECEYIHFGPTAAPDSAAVPALTDSRTHIEYVLEEKLRGPKRKIICFDELSRMSSDMQHMAMSLLNSRPTLAGKRIYNVIGFVATGNRGERDGVGHLDMATATRFGNNILDVEAPDVPSWKYFLASQHPDMDLTPVYSTWDNLTPPVRQQLTPRKMERIIWNLVNEGSVRYALSLRNSEREKFLDAAGEDVTQRTLDRIAAAMPSTSDTAVARTPIEAAIHACIEGKTAYVEGPPGIGKTDYVEASLAERCPDAQVWSLSMANARPEDWSLIMVTREGRLKRTLHQFLDDDSGARKYMILDEIWRAPNDVRDQVLELCQERTIAGIDTGITGIIALNNPRKWAGVTMDVGIADSAQADRFTTNVKVTESNIPWRPYLIDKYDNPETGVRVEHFLDFYDDDIRPDARVWFGPRCLENCILAYKAGLPLENSLPLVAGEPLEISFGSLKAALANRPFTTLETLRRELDDFVKVLTPPDTSGMSEEEAKKAMAEFEEIPEVHEYRGRAHTALIRADHSRLSKPENEELAMALYPLLGRSYCEQLVGANMPAHNVESENIDSQQRVNYWISIALAVSRKNSSGPAARRRDKSQ